jgi:hypothetical protein
MTINQPNIKFSTKQIVVRETSTRPYVGFEKTGDTPDGFDWDIKRWCSPFDLKLPSLPKMSDPSDQGLSNDYFRSGVGSAALSDLYINEIIEKIEEEEKKWYPFTENGFYYRYNVDYFYYSDNSRVEYIDTADNRDNRNYIELNKEPNIVDPILAANFRRSIVSGALYHTRVYQRSRFTGLYENEEELDTISEVGKIYWNNVDTTKREFITDNTIDGITRLFFNRDYSEEVGTVVTQYNDLAACEQLGVSTGAAYQIFYLEYFPVLADSSFHLYVADTTSYEEWTRVDTWWELINDSPTYPNKRYFLDKDLGIVYFGSAAAGGIPAIGTHIVAAYTMTLRIEYEELNFDTKVTAVHADVNPINQSLNKGFVCISHGDTEPTSIALEINKRKISGSTEYGPITVGSDYAILKASVTAIGGLPSTGIEVGFSMTPTNLGFLDGESVSTSLTDASGDAYSSYQPPVSGESLGFYSTTVRNSTHPSYLTGYKDLILNSTDAGLEGEEDNIYLYQILKDDPLMGYETLDEYLLSLYYDLSPAWVQDADDYAQWKEEMIAEHSLVEWDGASVAEGQPINGRKVVAYKLYEFSDLLTDGDFETYTPTETVTDGNFETALTDIITDGDFEAAGTTNWTASSCTLSKEPGARTGGSGTQILRITKTSASTGTGFQTPSITAFNSYRATGWARGDGISSYPEFDLSVTEWTGTTSNSWQYFDVIVENPSFVKLKVVGGTTGGYTEWDDFKIEDQNGVWEWVTNGITVSRESSDLPGSNTLMRIWHDSSTRLKQDNILTAGNRYTITGWARASGIGSEYPRVYHDSTVIWTGTNSTSWQEIKLTFYANSHDIWIDAYNTSGATEYCEFDNISIKDELGTYWKFSGTGAALRVSSDLPNSNTSMEITIGSGSPRVYNKISLGEEIGKSYNVTGWAKSDGSGTPYIKVDDTNTTLWTGTTSTNWQYIDETFVCSAVGQAISLYISGSTGDSVQYDNITFQDTEVLSENYDQTAINPVTGELGAITPVRPELVEKITTVGDPYYGKYRLIYNAGTLPDPGVGSSYTVGGYWAIASRPITFQAECWSPYYNKYIYSNTITARINLPNYLLGEYVNESNQKVPFGWRLLDDNNNDATGLDGATFITINPFSGPYNVIDIIDDTGETDVWADAPFRTLSFSFTIN